jgi:hypothetical protein
LPPVQNFKIGDEKELKMQASGEPAFASTEAALDQFYAEGPDSNAFVLSLYDQGRMPFSKRVSRAAFVDFFQEAVSRFPFAGSFESYIFILQQLFGADSTIEFTVPAPGKLEIEVNAAVDILHEAMVRELDEEGTGYTLFNLADSEGDDIVFSGVSGIETEYELQLLLAELIPGGIFPTITLNFGS